MADDWAAGAMASRDGAACPPHARAAQAQADVARPQPTGGVHSGREPLRVYASLLELGQETNSRLWEDAATSRPPVQATVGTLSGRGRLGIADGGGLRFRSHAYGRDCCHFYTFPCRNSGHYGHERRPRHSGVHADVDSHPRADPSSRSHSYSHADGSPPRLTKAPTPTPEAETTLSPAEEAAIEALPWVSNGLTNNEQQIVVRPRELAGWAEPVFQELVSKPWVSGTQDNPQWELVVRYLFHMAAEDEAAALRTLELKFLDTYELGDSATTLFLRDLLQSDPDALWELLSHPRLSPEAREDQPDSLALLYLQSRNPEAAALMESLPWVEDGLEGGEQHSVLHLQELALTSERVFQAFLAEEREWLLLDPWIDVRVVQLLVSISELDESSALEILDLPLLQSVGIAEYEALHRLRDFLRLDPALFHEALAHPALSRANYDDVGVVVSLLYLEHIDPEAAEALEGLAWVQDGVGRPAREDVFSANADPTEFEERILFGLIELSTRSHELSMAMVNEPWMQDGMGFGEYMSLYPLMDLVLFPCNHDG